MRRTPTNCPILQKRRSFPSLWSQFLRPRPHWALCLRKSNPTHPWGRLPPLVPGPLSETLTLRGSAPTLWPQEAPQGEGLAPQSPSSPTTLYTEGLRNTVVSKTPSFFFFFFWHYSDFIQAKVHSRGPSGPPCEWGLAPLSIGFL